MSKPLQDRTKKFSVAVIKLLQATLKDRQCDHQTTEKSQPHILAHLVLPDTQADPSQNQKS